MLQWNVSMLAWDNWLVLTKYESRTRPNAFLPQCGGGRLKRTLTLPLGSACSVFLQAHGRAPVSKERPVSTSHSSARFKAHPHSLSEHLTSFQVSCYKGKCKQSVFRGRSVSQASICMFFKTLLLLPDLFHIKRAVNLYHKNRLRKSE